MKKILIFSCLAAFAIACGSAEGKQQTAKATVAGEKVYKTYCVTCHGLYGDMGASGAIDLTKSILSLDERISVVTDGRNAMTPFKNLLNEEKIMAVAAYTLELKKE